MNVFIASIENNNAILTPEESWHCSKVLRCRAGEKINVIDGKGNFYTAILELVSEKKCIATLIDGPIQQKSHDYYLHLAIAPTKQIDRIEWMIEKAVEIGIDEISFIQCKNSERVNIKLERIIKIVESAVKQSLQACIPKVNDLRPIKDILQDDHSKIKLIAHCNEDEKKPIKEFDLKGNSILILIGPEGDFTKEEVATATEKGFNAITLGTNRLRTETAGLYVCQAVSFLCD